MSKICWRIPPSVLEHLERVASDQAVAVLLRHSVREELPPGEAGNSVPITEIGSLLARELGGLLGGKLKSLHSSPVLRCMQTAEALRDGAFSHVPVKSDQCLGDPSVFVIDGQAAWSNWERLGHEGVMQHLMSGAVALPGMANPEAAARFLVHHMLSMTKDEPGIHIFVTHDSVVTATVAQLTSRPLGPCDWPWYLEGAFFCADEAGTRIVYRDYEACRSGPLCSLSKNDVIDFARREVAAAVGVNCDARFFLAGGAFKTLLSGRKPKDLDLWAPSFLDRERLIHCLRKRGASPLESRPFADAFKIAGRVIEVPHQVAPPLLTQRLACFDLALSAVGVEHRPDGNWSAQVHPLAQQSVLKREVLLLKPLVNWEFALTTLERMRRYAMELNYFVPSEEEAEVWQIFDSKSGDIQANMLENLRITGTGGFGVLDEAEGRRVVLKGKYCSNKKGQDDLLAHAPEIGSEGASAKE